ncbi:MAG: GatB/YqeY domain-containing protein [Bdellovibrionales bacterium]|nr:GatB/YqeY domain-containing protein [Bdellovibrionales bacterium]
MPTIKETNQENMKAAMKGGDKATTQYSRNLHAAIRKKEVDDRVDLNDEATIRLITTMLKQREESIAQFKAGGREDLVANEEAEAKYLRQFMPAQMSHDEIKAVVAAAIAETGAKDAKDLGKVMKVVQPKVAGKADGKLVNQFVREALGG